MWRAGADMVAQEIVGWEEFGLSCRRMTCEPRVRTTVDLPERPIVQLYVWNERHHHELADFAVGHSTQESSDSCPCNWSWGRQWMGWRRRF